MLLVIAMLGFTAFLPQVASASPTLERHSADFQVKVLAYGDVWTKNEIEALTSFLDGLKSQGLGYVPEALAKYGNILTTLVSKLAQLDKIASIALASVLGVAESLPEDLSARVEMLREADINGNTSAVIKVLNDLYSSGEISGPSYLALLGYVIREFKLQYVGDNTTINNIRRAVEEISSKLARPNYIEEPEHGVVGGIPVALVKLYRTPAYLLVGALLSLLAPVITQMSVSILHRSRTFKKLGVLGIHRYDLAPSSTSSPEDVVGAYKVAVDLLSRFYPLAPYETHREYLVKVSRESRSKLLTELLSVLTGEYERVRFGGQRPYLSGKQLIELLDRLEEELNSSIK